MEEIATGQPPQHPALSRRGGLGKISRGMGIEVVTTPLGVMTGREARRKKVGGEVLLRVW